MIGSGESDAGGITAFVFANSAPRRLSVEGAIRRFLNGDAEAPYSGLRPLFT